MLPTKGKTTVVVNFKGLKGIEVETLAQEIDRGQAQIPDSYDIVLAIQAVDAVRVSSLCRSRIFIQDIFSEDQYSFLNFFSNDYPGRDNISGVILNHPEKKLSESLLQESVEKARQMKIEMLICATSIEEGIRLSQYAPRFIGIENEELIGKSISFTDHCPEIVHLARKKIGHEILIGAGIRSAQDLRHVVNTGGAGVLVSSLILRSSDPFNELLKLLY